nr:EOG090X06BA [Ilyocryptus agilis]
MATNMEAFNQAIEKISNNDCVGLQELLKTIKIDQEDEHGMTLLQHAAFKKKKDICQLLLDFGADPNAGHHEHNYSTLHFGALSGDPEICQLLIQYGAKTDVVNSVGRTATQMAAFVGNHQCVTTINNFIPREDIEHYTIPSKGQSEPKLPPAVAPALHKLVMQGNLHPVYILHVIQKLPLLYDNIGKVAEVLQLLCDGQMKRGREANEILALKYHYLAYLVSTLAKELQKKAEKAASDIISAYLKLLVKRRMRDGFPEFMDSFVRESIRTFPYKETTVFRQLVVNLSKTKQELGSSLAITLLTSCVNGQRGFQDDDACAACGQEKVASKCAGCRSVQYCDRDCQKLHWSFHKTECADLAKQIENLKVKEETGNGTAIANDSLNYTK